MDLELLWLLDLASDNHPTGAHQIEHTTTNSVRVTFCGLHATARTHPRGWWMGKPSTLPHDLPIHCGPWSRT